MKLILPAMSILILVVAVALIGCDAIGEIRHLDLGDVSPPQLNAQTIQDTGTITLEFDEPVTLHNGSLHLNSEDSAIQVQPDAGANTIGAKKISLEIQGETIPGKQYSLELMVEDTNQNSLNIVMPFYGPNRNPARLIISEVLTAISSKNRDTIELYAQKGGNIGGITLFWGTTTDFDFAWSLPALEVRQGDYILLHCKPENLPAEQDELNDVLASGGKNASPLARDFWLRDAPGLPDTTGILCLAENPLGAIKDALFYTDKLSVAGKDYRSFGTKKLLERAERLQAEGAWKCRGDLIVVEDAARSENLTATRSLNRGSNQADTDSAADWHIVPTNQTSLGTRNNDAVYIKP